MLLRNLTPYTLAALSLTAVPMPMGAQTPGADEQAIREVIEAAYVTGVFITRDTIAVRAGFHPRFVLSVHQADSVILAPLDMWLQRLALDGKSSSDTVVHRFDRVDVTGSTAVVKLQLFINGAHEYTDYFGLYRFAHGWRIVTKVFQSHD